MHIARRQGFSIAHFASDSLEVIQAIKGGLDWSIATIVSDILEYVKYFSSVEFFHVCLGLLIGLLMIVLGGLMDCS